MTGKELFEEYQKLFEKYKKYKRAFEILKNHNLSVGKNANTETGYYVYCESELMVDEAELLEELMRDENTKQI